MPSYDIKSFYKELRRRHVFKASVAYVVIAWLIAQVAEVLTDAFNSPDWVLQSFIILLVLGFPVAVVLAWVYELTSDGIVLDSEALVADREITSTKEVHDSSVAVLSLEYLGAIERDAYIAAGITEDLTTLLSRTPGLFVVARNSSRKYSGKPATVRQIAEQLGVRYVVQGSVRRVGDHLRVNAQLIEAASEKHIWAQRFDFQEAELFQYEEDICLRISTQLVSSIEKAESARASIMPADKLDSWLLTQQAIQLWWSGADTDTVEKAFELIDEALAKDPDYPYALAFHGFLCVISLLVGINHDEEKYKKMGLESITAAIRLAPDDPFVLFYWGSVQAFTGNRKHAILALERARKGNPNDPHIVADLGYFLIIVGKREEGIALLRRAFALSPYEPRSYTWHCYLGVGLVPTDPEAALEEFEKAISKFDRYTGALAAKLTVLAYLGREEEAYQAGITLYERRPGIKLADLIRMYEMSIEDKEDRERAINTLKKYANDELIRKE